ncbi:unnamed protein product, partial [marine sediment metagenome]
VDWHGHGRITYLAPDGTGRGAAGKITSVGKFKVIEHGGQTVYSGQIDLSWRDLALQSLRVDQVKDLALDRLAGRSTGQLTFKIFSDFRFDWQIKSELEQIDLVRTNAPEPTRIKRLAMSLAGAYDPVTGKLNLRTFDLASPVVALESRFRGRFEPGGLFINEVRVAGRFDSELLVQQVPALAAMLTGSASLTGPCQFDVSWRSSQVLDAVKLKLDATEADLNLPGAITKRAGTPLTLKLALTTDPSN